MELAARTRWTVRRYWADRLGVDVSAFDGGTTVGAADEGGVQLFDCDDALVVGAPGSPVDALRDRADQAPAVTDLEAMLLGSRHRRGDPGAEFLRLRRPREFRRRGLGGPRALPARRTRTRPVPGRGHRRGVATGRPRVRPRETVGVFVGFGRFATATLAAVPG